MIAPQVEESPDRPQVDDDQPMYDDFAPLVDQRSDDFDDEDLLGEVPGLEDEAVESRTAALQDETGFETTNITRVEARGPVKRTIKISKYGIEYPSLPPAVVKRLAQNFAKAGGIKGKITPDAMKSIMQASDWFFEQMSEDLQAYAKHAGRKTIDESDVLTLMKRYGTIYHWVFQIRLHMTLTLLPSRQRQINPNTTPFALAQRNLPRELLQELRMPPPVIPKKRRKIKGVDDDDVT